MTLRWITLLLVSLSTIGNAQTTTLQKFTLSGNVKDKSNGESLIGAVIQVVEKPGVGAKSNEYGFYSLSLPEGKYTFKVTYVGYQDELKTLDLSNSLKQDWLMQNTRTLKEVTIKSKKENDNLTRTTMGMENLNMKEIAKIPVLLGEKDVLKTIQLLPGVKSAGEGNSGFYVRGGSADQNLILLDEAPVYNASHLLGFFSTFNSDAIKDATLIKGNAPANYGGRLSSVLDVKMKEGNNKNYAVNGGIGLISSRLSIEGPIQKDKSSFIISGRRTYADVFLKATEDFKENTLYFYDLNAKANYRINEKNRLFLSGYFGRDILGFGDNFGFDWGNKTGTLRWNRIFNSKLFSNTSVIYSDYNYNINIKSGVTDFNINSNIKDWNLKEDLSYFHSPTSSWRFGFNSIRHAIRPSRFEGTVTSTPKAARLSWENALYFNHVKELNAKWNIDYGARLSSFTLLGGDTYRIFDMGVLKDSIVLKSGELGKTYANIEPRATVGYMPNQNSSFKMAFSRNTQHLHLLSNSTSSNPTDQWIGNSYNIKPEISNQWSAGYSRNFKKDTFEFGVEVYYKDLQRQVDYKNGADIQTTGDVEGELLFGKGRAYGLELIVRKKQGRFTGWVSYTLSRTERKIDGINNNEWYLARQDRLHDLSVVGIYQLSKNWSASGLFVFYSGNAVTFPSGKYNIGGNTAYYYTERNGYRMPAYHRLDFSLTYERQTQKKFQSSWNFGLYNVYGRQNAYTITFRDNENDPTRTEAVQTSLFRWVPSITYNFKF
jgi:hypothetical protein